MIDKECLDCKRYYSGSCNGVEDRQREEITIENSCSGHLKKNDFNGGFDMKEVSIVPTEETSWGIADEYNIKDYKNNMILHKNVARKSLVCIIKDNDYKVISGEKYL